MSKNINKIEHFNLSLFPNTITGKYNPKTGSPSSSTVKDNNNPNAPVVDPNIYGGFTLRPNKLPADGFGNIIPVNTVDPSTNSVTPSIFYESMDETATYNNNTFLKGLNDALSECIKQGDTCYAIVIKYQPNNASDSNIYSSNVIKEKGIHNPPYRFELAQKPSQNDINDSESLFCNSLYFTYLKNKTVSGVSNIMPNSIACEFNTGEVNYEGSSGNNVTKTGSGTGSGTASGTGSGTKSTKEPPKKGYSYKDSGGSKPKKTQFPWFMVISITACVLFIGAGIYYYYNFGPGAPIIPVKKVVKGGLLTSKFIKKSGGYFFFV